MKKNELAVVPTAELLSEMETLEIVGGIGDISGNYVLARCPENTDCTINTYCGTANCANCVNNCGITTSPDN